MLSFPKKTFSKDQIIKLLSLIKNEINKDKFQDITNSFTKETYNEEDYFYLIRENSFLMDLLDSLNKVNYIPYIFFNLPTNNFKMQRDCVSILMNNEKDLKTFIINSLDLESEFYCLDISFWREWCIYCDWDFGLNTVKENSNEKNKESNYSNDPLYNNNGRKLTSDSMINNNNDIKLEIHIDYISGIVANALRPGLEYFLDYVLVTSKIYRLFKLWYNKHGDDILVKKISYSSIEFKKIFQLQSDAELLNDQNFIKNWPVVKFNSNKNSIDLIEVYPLNSRFFKYDEIISSLKVSLINVDAVKDILEKVINNPNSNVRRTLFLSRKTNFVNIKNTIYDFGSLPVGSKANSRIWIYSDGELNIITNEEATLESFNIANKIIIIVEIKVNNQWPSDLLFLNDANLNSNGKNISSNNNNNYAAVEKNTNKIYYGKGIVNIGNTCYMNSVLQMLLNLDKLKLFLDDMNFPYWINRKNKYGFKGKIISEFFMLFKEYHLRNKEPVRPHKFKAAIGEINPQFKNFDQQDSQEFLSYLIDVLHEELNIKSEKEYIPNPENYDGTEEQLSGEYWANNLRRNASFIHSLFLGQMKSTLTCAECKEKKITYETFTNLNIPIPQKKTILLNIIIHRIPFTYKAYYFEQYEKQNNKLNTKNFINEKEGNSMLTNDMKPQGENENEYFNLDQSPKNDFEKNDKNKENKINIESIKNGDDCLEYNLENISGLTVRDRLNFLRKESYEKIKLISKNITEKNDEDQNKKQKGDLGNHAERESN